MYSNKKLLIIFRWLWFIYLSYTILAGSLFQTEKAARDDDDEVHQASLLPVDLRFRQHDRYGRSGRRIRRRSAGASRQRLPTGIRGGRRLRQKRRLLQLR